MSDIEFENEVRKTLEYAAERRAKRHELMAKWQEVLCDKPLHKIEWLEEADVTIIDNDGEY